MAPIFGLMSKIPSTSTCNLMADLHETRLKTLQQTGEDMLLEALVDLQLALARPRVTES